MEGAPVGRRVFLGMMGLGAAGVLWGRRVQDGLERVFAGNPVSSFLPTGGRFRIYSVVGFLPSRTRAEYRLAVDGLVDRPLDLGYGDLLEMTPTAITRDFQCVTGWRVKDVPWRGVRLADVLDRAGVKADATAVTFWSFDGVYSTSLDLDDARRQDVLVAYELEGKQIGRAHGGPVRLYVAPMYGYKSIKWLDRIELTPTREVGYWEKRGYDDDAWVGRSNGRDDAPTA